MFHLKNSRLFVALTLLKRVTFSKKLLIALTSIGFITAISLGALNAPSADASSNPWQTLNNVPNFNPGIMFLLTDGRVLIQDQGANNSGTSNWWLLSPNSKGSYVDGSWQKAGAMPSGYMPMYAASSVLPDGRVIVEGGESNGSSTWVGENLGAIYDPITNTWSAVAPPSNGQGEFSSIADAPSSLMADGSFIFGPSGNGDKGAELQQQSAILNSSDLSWKVVGKGMVGANPEAGYTLLPSGKILMIDTPVDKPAKAEVFDPMTDTWTPTNPMPQTLLDPISANGSPIAEIGPAITLLNGTVFAEGSNENTAIYNEDTNSWTAGPKLPFDDNLQMKAEDAASAVLKDGSVLMDVSPTANSEMVPPAHFYTFKGNSYSPIPAPQGNYPPQASNNGYMLKLPNGQVLFCERMGPSSLYLYNDNSVAADSALPKIAQAPNQITAGSTYQISGNQLAGLTQGSEFGDDWNNQTNYPLVQIQNNQTGDISYARTSGMSSLSIAANAPSTFNFQVPTNVESGASTLRVVASGFASKPWAINVTSTNNPPALSKKYQCVKGKVVKTYFGATPKCPVGYKLKNS